MLSEFKKKLFEQMEDEIEAIEKVLPIFHILIYAFTHLSFSDREKMRALA
jgi:hypothetical protein